VKAFSLSLQLTALNLPLKTKQEHGRMTGDARMGTIEYREGTLIATQCEHQRRRLGRYVVYRLKNITMIALSE